MGWTGQLEGKQLGPDIDRLDRWLESSWVHV
jgi:hypothetical protein